jgi:hypothetical protein
MNVFTQNNRYYNLLKICYSSWNTLYMKHLHETHYQTKIFGMRLHSEITVLLVSFLTTECWLYWSLQWSKSRQRPAAVCTLWVLKSLTSKQNQHSSFVREVQSTSLGPKTGYFARGFSRSSSVPPVQFCDSTLKVSQMTPSFRLIYNSSFTYRPFIRRYIILSH